MEAYFNGSVYRKRSYKRKIVYTEPEARQLYNEAVDYYNSSSYYTKYLNRVVIEEREVSDWREYDNK